MTKQGFLLGETTVKLIIAVICLGFLVYFLFSLYTSGEDDKTRQAHAILSDSASGSLKTIFERVRRGEGNEGGIAEEKALPQPSGWHLMAFIDGEVKPNACAGERCVCICDEVFFDSIVFLSENRQAKECNSDGACLIVSDLANNDFSYAITQSTIVRVAQNSHEELEVALA